MAAASRAKKNTADSKVDEAERKRDEALAAIEVAKSKVRVFTPAGVAGEQHAWLVHGSLVFGTG